MVESVFSSLDRLGLSERSLVHRQSLSRQGIVPYRKPQGLVFHLYAVPLGYGLFKLMEHNPAWRLLLAQLGGMWLVAFPNWGCSILPLGNSQRHLTDLLRHGVPYLRVSCYYFDEPMRSLANKIPAAPSPPEAAGRSRSALRTAFALDSVGRRPYSPNRYLSNRRPPCQRI